MNQLDPHEDYPPHSNPSERWDDYTFWPIVKGTADGFQIQYPHIDINLTARGAREIVERFLEISLGVEGCS